MKASPLAFSVLVALLPAGVVLSQAPFIPGSAETEGLSRIVPDTITFDFGGRNAIGNWEPFASVLGNAAFLIESNTFAEGTTTDMQRFGLTFQAVAGGDLVPGEVFFTDAGLPYAGPINNYRQNGNPGRVAGDKRPGAVNLIAGGEASPDELAPFQSDARWDTGVIRGGRYAVVQTYSLDLTTLEQEAICKAFDAINGRLAAGDPGTDQIGRFGGDLAALDDGNFVVVVDDRSRLHVPDEKAAVAVIVAPDGSIVKESFLIGVGELWSNVAAFQGGFCVRLAGILKFYDNEGSLLGEVDQQDPLLVDPLEQPILFDRLRGDGTRIAAHINSPYVYLAGVSAPDVRIAVWDSRDQTYVAQANVNELTDVNGGVDAADFRPGLDRVNLAVDALNRVVVTYEVILPGVAQPQTVARVLAFDEEEKSFSYLTSSFFPFINYHDGTLGEVGVPIRVIRPSPAMTTREICIAAKGEISSVNDPTLGADTPAEVNFYTVFAHPDPQDDPTMPVGGRQTFRRGDTNNDGKQDISDAVFMLGHLFLGGPRWVCDEGSDTNDAGKTDISDAVFLLGHLFLGGATPPAPYPDCGVDPNGESCPLSSCNV